MLYFCRECRKVIREEDVKTWEEPSEAWGHIVYEEWLVCPSCGEPVEEYTEKETDDE